MKTSLEDITEALEYTKSWYRRLPTKATLPLWISSARGLVGAIFPAENSKFEITMSSKNQFTGAVEVKKPGMRGTDQHTLYRIIIGSIFVDSAQLRNTEIESFHYPSVSLFASNGTVVHEAAHLRYGSLMGFGQYLGEYQNLFRIIFNVIEDLYIENMIFQNFKPLYPFVKGKNAFLFNDRTISMLDKSDAGQGVFDVVDIFLTMSKRYTDFSHAYMFKINNPSVSLDKVAEMAKQVFELDAKSKVEDRVRIALDILNYLESSLGSSKMHASEISNQAMQNSESDTSQSGMEGHPGKTTEKLPKGFALGGAIEENKRNNFAKVVNFLSKMDNIDASGMIAEIVMTVPESANELPMDDKYKEISKHLRQMATQSSTFGPASNRGHLVGTRLYRVATDGKMFGKPEEITKFKKDFEISLLVDCSGSMHGGIGGEWYTGQTRIDAAMRAAVGIKYALESANIRCNVYGHTADFTKISPDNFLMFKLAPHEVPASAKVMARRAQTATQGGIPFENNRDNLAIKWVGENGFSKSNSRKVMIVISDGQPSAHGFNYDEAIQDTKKEVDKVRAGGKTVVAISICKSAMEANNEIYGEKFNVCDNDPNVVVKIVEQIMSSKI